MNLPTVFDNAKDITCCVIGVGQMGLRHIQAVQELGMQLVGLADVSSSALHKACDASGLDRSSGFVDSKEMLCQTRPNAVVVATTAPDHAELVIDAAKLNVKYILCEKPMACSLDQADLMVSVCASHKVTLAVNHQMRFMPHYKRVKELIGGEELGSLSSILVAGSNFGLAMNASHYFEMFHYITGGPVKTVKAWFENSILPNPRGPEFQDRSGCLLAASAAGSKMFIDFSSFSGHGLEVAYLCRNGKITVDELTGEIRVSARRKEFRELPTSRYGMPAEVWHEMIAPTDTLAPTKSVWSAMFSGKSFPSGNEGRHALACLVAAHVSDSRDGCPVAIDDPSLPHNLIFPWA